METEIHHDTVYDLFHRECGGALLRAGEKFGMNAMGFEIQEK